MCLQPQIGISLRIEHKKEIRTNFVKKLQFSYSNLICIINFAQIISYDVTKETSKDALIIGPQVLKVSFWLFQSINFKVGKI